MAQHIFVSLVDDIDGSEADETVQFALDGVTYEIDLSAENAEELREFESHPHFEAAVRLRRYDDMGKVPGMETPGLDAYRGLMEALSVEG